MSNSTPALLYCAKKEVEHVKKGQIFIVRDLFIGHYWDTIPLEDRLQLGRDFLDYVEGEGKKLIVMRDKTDSGQQRYEKL